MSRKIRLAIGSPAEMHSGAWSIWTQGDELYAAQSSARGVLKLSVHSSGICRYAWSEVPDVRHARDRDPRVIDRWRIDPVGASPWTVCFTLFVPGVFIPNRFTHEALVPSRRAAIRWVAPTLLGHVRMVTLFRAQTAGQHISELLTGEYEVLQTLSLRSGGMVWVVSYDEVLSTKDANWWQWAVSDMKLTYPDGLPPGALATVTSAAGGHPYPVLRDVALGWSNLRVDEA